MNEGMELLVTRETASDCTQRIFRESTKRDLHEAGRNLFERFSA